MATNASGPSPVGTISSVVKDGGFWHRFGQLFGAYWYAPHRRKVWGWTTVLLLLTVGQVGLAIWTTYWHRALFDALEQRDMTEFLWQVGIFGLIFLLTMLVTAAHLQVKRWLQLDWRDFVTARVLDHWMCKGRHYQLLYTPGEHDNPDGRIAEDIQVVTVTFIALAHTLVFSLLILFTFVDILLVISGSATLPGTDVVVPGYMVVAAILYAGVGAAVGFSLGRPLVRSTNRLQNAEADFRFGLARARENAESIALMQGEQAERNLSARLFRGIVRDWNRQTLAYTWIVSYTTGYGALLPVFPILIAAPQYIAGVMSLGILMQTANAFQRLTGALSWPVDSLGEIARCRASADRVLSLYQDLLQLEHGAAAGPDDNRIMISHATQSALEVDDLTVARRDGQVVLENFSMLIQPGERVLISGDPSVADCLFKVVAGLWPWGRGQVSLPRDGAICFVPQRPFLPTGTLQTALSYPAAPETHDESAMRLALECAGLGWLCQRLGEADEWHRVLSLRAQQRLGFARLFLQRPGWIFIDDASDALDSEAEQQLMASLFRELPDATVITISAHAGLQTLHQREIVMQRMAEEKLLFQIAPFCLMTDNPGNGKHRGSGAVDPSAADGRTN